MASPIPTANRESISSIQLALDLEHQLDSHPHDHDHDMPSSSASPVPADTGLPYDPEVLTSIIIQLRANVATVSHERDQSNQALADAGHKYAALEARTADLQEHLDTERARAEKAELERDEALRLAQENDEQVNLLRAKVEESRRGVMRLQAESRRMSTQTVKTTGPLPLDLSLTGVRSPGLSSGFPSAVSAKRASFQYPLSSAAAHSPVSSRPTAGGHRRISSLSDPGSNANAGLTLSVEPVSIIDGLPPSPATHTFEDLRNGDGTTIKTKRLSLLSPRPRDMSPPSPQPSSILTAELETIRSELSSTKKELDGLKHELAEAHDKRDASEACIKALREFIAEQAIGDSTNPDADSLRESVGSPVMSLKGLKLPPLPSEKNIDDGDASSKHQQKASGGWGLRLWRENSGTAAAAPAAPVPEPTPTPAASTSTEAGTPLTSFVSSWTRSVSGNSLSNNGNGSNQTPAVSPNPSTDPAPTQSGIRKFSFFSKAPPPPLPTKSAAPSIAESSSTPELSRSESTSPQTVTSGVLFEDEHEHDDAHDVLVLKRNSKGDVTPTEGALMEKMEAIAL